MDVSDSTKLPFSGDAPGDVNRDGEANTVLDGELAGLIAINQALIDQGGAPGAPAPAESDSEPAGEAADEADTPAADSGDDTNDTLAEDSADTPAEAAAEADDATDSGDAS